MRRATSCAVAVQLVTTPLHAHGEQVLVFPFSWLILLIIAALTVGVSWHRFRTRLLVVLVLFSSNALLCFTSLASRIAAVAAGDMTRALVILVLVPCVVAGAVAAAVYLGMRRNAA